MLNIKFAFQESEAISFVATASKLATVEDEGPKRPEGPIRSSAASLKVSPTARATLQALRSPKSKLVTRVSTRDAETITGKAKEIFIIFMYVPAVAWPMPRNGVRDIDYFTGYLYELYYFPSNHNSAIRGIVTL